MNALKRVSRIAVGFGVTAGFIVSRSAAKWLENQYVSDSIILVTTLAIVAILAKLSQMAAESIIANIRLIRRWILGRQFIEGVWIDLMEEGGMPVSFGLTRINIIEGELKISGDDYDSDGAHTGYYTCEFFKYDWPRIRYVYSYQRSDDSEIMRQGYGEFMFDDTGAPPIMYTGHYIDLKEGTRFRFEGWKLKDRARMKRLQTPEGRRTVIKDFYQEQLEKRSGDKDVPKPSA